MKIPAAILLLAVTCSAQEDPAVVRFSNGDRLSGEVKELSQDALFWSSKILAEPAEFDLKHVLDLTMPAGIPQRDGPAPGHEAILEMTNGDSVRGQLSALNDEQIGIKTWYAGDMTFRRVNVKNVRINGAADYFYRGPVSMEEWTVDGAVDSWLFKGGALYSEGAGGVAREIDLPEESSISFDASWRGSFRPKIIFYSDDITTTSPRNGYEMVFQGSAVHVKKCGTSSWLGHSSNAGILRENEKARIEIRTSLRTGKILLYVDGDFIDIWEDADVEKKSLGKGFHIVSQDGIPLRISNIAVTTWDGYTEDVPNRQERFQGRGFRGGFEFDDNGMQTETPESVVPEGRMILKNGDTIEGEVLSIDGDLITLKTPFTEVTFPVARLKNLVLKKADLETPKRNKGDVRATLADGSRLVFRLDGVEDDTLIGFSQNFGTARFSRSAFKKIEFNIYNSSLDNRRVVDEW